MNKFFHEISEAWACGDIETEVAKELGITVEEVKEVYGYLDAEVEKLYLLNKQFWFNFERNSYGIV